VKKYQELGKKDKRGEKKRLTAVERKKIPKSKRKPPKRGTQTYLRGRIKNRHASMGKARKGQRADILKKSSKKQKPNVHPTNLRYNLLKRENQKSERQK